MTQPRAATFASSGDSYSFVPPSLSRDGFQSVLRIRIAPPSNVRATADGSGRMPTEKDFNPVRCPGGSAPPPIVTEKKLDSPASAVCPQSPAEVRQARTTKLYVVPGSSETSIT